MFALSDWSTFLFNLKERSIRVFTRGRAMTFDTGLTRVFSAADDLDNEVKNEDDETNDSECCYIPY